MYVLMNNIERVFYIEKQGAQGSRDPSSQYREEKVGSPKGGLESLHPTL